MKFASSGISINYIPKIKVILALTIIFCYVNIAKTDQDKNITSVVKDIDRNQLNQTSKSLNVTNINENTFANYTIPQNGEIMPVRNFKDLYSLNNSLIYK